MKTIQDFVPEGYTVKKIPEIDSSCKGCYFRKEHIDSFKIACELKQDLNFDWIKHLNCGDNKSIYTVEITKKYNKIKLRIK